MRPHLYKRPCPSVGRLVRRSVGPSVMLSSKSMKNGLLRILNDLDSAGRGGRRDEEEGGTRREEGRGGRRDEDEGGTRERRDEESDMKNEKVAEGCIIGLAGPCYLIIADFDAANRERRLEMGKAEKRRLRA